LLGINLSVKHDDLYPIYGGGNKARKLPYILKSANKANANAIVTAGSLQSNHVRATSVMCAELGWKAIMIIHDRQPSNKNFSANLKLTHLMGAELRFVNMDQVAQEMNVAMDDLRDGGHNPYYIWGGGHSPEGSYAYYQAVKELKKQLKNNSDPDFIFVANGTGSTHAGIVVGCQKFLPNTDVVGISISRTNKRAVTTTTESIEELKLYLKGVNTDSIDPIKIDDSFVGAGYESVYPELISDIRMAARTEGLILDPTYTGKVFHAITTYVKQKRIPPDSSVLFWHTGGLLNLLASDIV
jgi:1-aminocyclopropane-1-carboxylate deaminase/D-cysteine desulfhydrase-like pyridoxal-dependent ACC family enzyme